MVPASLSCELPLVSIPQDGALPTKQFKHKEYNFGVLVQPVWSKAKYLWVWWAVVGYWVHLGCNTWFCLVSDNLRCVCYPYWKRLLMKSHCTMPNQTEIVTNMNTTRFSHNDATILVDLNLDLPHISHSVIPCFSKNKTYPKKKS